MNSRRGFTLGCAVDGVSTGGLEPQEQLLLDRHFDSITPENCMKPGPIHPEPLRYDFAAADALVDFAERHGMSVAGHCLVWHQQCPPWLFQGHDGAAVDRETLLDRLRQHIAQVVSRYRGRVASWDVVNEAVADAGAQLLRATPWREIIGDDFVSLAFRFAREADPDARLVYNDYDIEAPEKRARTVRLLGRLLAEGVRVDEVGIQGHWQLDRVPFGHIAEAIREYAALGLDVSVTELDIDVVERAGCGADLDMQRAQAPVLDLYREGCDSDVLERQAAQYEELFELLVAAGPRIRRVTLWGLHDGKSWLNYWPTKRTNHPLLFDRSCRPKPAWERVARVLETAG